MIGLWIRHRALLHSNELDVLHHMLRTRAAVLMLLLVATRGLTFNRV